MKLDTLEEIKAYLDSNPMHAGVTYHILGKAIEATQKEIAEIRALVAQIKKEV
jgi:hypothetical protein